MEKSNFRKFLNIFLWVLFIVLIGNIYLQKCNRTRPQLAVSSHKWDKLLLVLDQIEKNYVDSIDYREVVEQVLPHLMQELDPHSVYLPPVELEQAEESLEGNFSGIGIQFNVPNDTIIVINVVPGGPSEKAGLMSGDRIVRLDGENVAGVKMPQDSMVRRMKGPSGTKVEVDVRRDNLDEPVHFSIVRDRIPVKSLDVALMLADSTGYVKLAKFSRTSYVEFLKALAPLEEKGLRRLIFDLRDNTGGYLDQALLLSNEFLDKGDLIVYMEGGHRKRQEFHADGRGLLRDVELYVLVNESSASSSEIFAGAMQDNDRATIVGRRSFGKGLVQEPIYFSDNSGIRLTVARFYTPTGRCIQKPYSEDYNYDILERYRHGEMTVADSIRRVDSLKYITPGGKAVYGGGGITPDVFVPLDTVGVTDFLIACNKKSLIIKYSNVLADLYRPQLRTVKTFSDLEHLIGRIDLEGGFLAYARRNGAVPAGDDWQISRNIILTQLKALFGRYTVLDDRAFYPYMLQIDNVVEKVEEMLEEKKDIN